MKKIEEEAHTEDPINKDEKLQPTLPGPPQDEVQALLRDLGQLQEMREMEELPRLP